MVRLLVLITLAQLFIVPLGFSKAYGLDDNVKIRIKKDIHQLKISGFFKAIGRYQFKGKSKLNLLVAHKNLSGKDYWQVQNIKNKKSIYFKSKRLTFLGTYFTSGSENIPEHFVLWKETSNRQRPSTNKLSKKNSFHLVAEMPMDQYLKGVLAGEMPLSWPKEALKAQAIASKSYALSVANERKNKYYHLEGDVYDQVYKHTHNNKYAAKLSEIVKETSNEYLMGDNGKVLKAYYHANSGGATELPINVWQDADWNPMYKVVKSPDSNKWSYQLSTSQFIKNLSKEHPGFNAAALKTLKVYEKSESGRVTSLSFDAGSGSTVITGQKLRELVGFGKLKSTFFSFNIKATQISFVGKGYGHGVGMSQKGASLLARKGWSYKNILKHFYPKVMVTREPGSVTP